VSLQRSWAASWLALKPDESLDSFTVNRTASPTFTGFLEHLRPRLGARRDPVRVRGRFEQGGRRGVRLIVDQGDRRFSFRQMILERRRSAVWAT
jgi:hypothetical protein